MLEKLEIKINILKRKMNPKLFGVVLFMLFAASAIFGMEMANMFKRQKQKAQDMYNKAMYEMIGYVKNVETELSKVQLVSTTNLTSTTLASVWKQASNAKEQLESLPIEQGAMSNASKYLSQVSDYSYVLLKDVVSGNKITDKEYEDIKKMHEESVELTKVVSQIYADLNNGRIKWDELTKLGNDRLKDVNVAQNISNVDKIGKTFQEYEGLIYDGAFSDHLLTTIPKFLEDEKESTEYDAKRYLENVFGIDNIEKIEYTGESNGVISLHTFKLKIKGEKQQRDISVTKKGCKMYLMISDKKVTEEKISMEEAKKKGLEFLKSMGIENVEDTYYLKVENMAIINYAATEKDTTLYPDLIKVKVALDDGVVYSVEAQGYIFNHTKRENLKPGISIKEAKKIINKDIEISSENLAIIPTESKSEILVYEFKGKINDIEFIIYVNAHTKMEEKILMIIDTPDGKLTM